MDLDKLNLKLDCQSAPPMKLQLNAQTLEFNRMCNQYEFWFDSNDSFPSVDSSSKDEQQLARWSKQMREEVGLTTYQINQFDSLDGWYWTDEQMLFFSHYFTVKHWIQVNKRFPRTSAKAYDERLLAFWCRNQRRAYEDQRLTQAQISTVEKLPGWYWVYKEPKPSTYEYVDIDALIVTFRAWFENNNVLPSPNSDNSDEQKLAILCDCIRKIQKQLPNNQFVMLDELDEWYWNNDDEQFMVVYLKLRQWVNVNERIPHEHVNDDEERSLASWCSLKRINHKKQNLDHRREQRLEKIPHWYWNDEYIDTRSFEDKVKSIVEWVNKYGELPSNSLTGDIVERKLAKWCGDKRQYYKKNLLSQEQILQLESIEGWEWKEDICFDVRPFDIKYQELILWIEIFGKIPSKDSDDVIESKLGNFCGTIRHKKRKNLFSTDIICRIETIPGWWWWQDIPKIVKSFDQGLNELKSWVDTYKSLPTKNKFDCHGQYLYRWCKEKRYAYRLNKLEIVQIQKLEAIEGWYWEYIHDSNSKIAMTWLSMIGVNQSNLQTAMSPGGEYLIPLTKYHVDGYNQDTNTVYEFLGDFWHGNPKLYKSTDVNTKCGKTFGELFESTEKRKRIIISMGYKYYEIWETDWWKTINLISRAKIAWKKRRYLSKKINNPVS
jgi:hypothetical protein